MERAPGPARSPQDVSNTIAQLPALVQSLTGVDLISTLKNLPGIVSDDNNRQSGQSEDVDGESSGAIESRSEDPND